VERRPHIIVKGTKTGLPYSKGLLASSVLATGLSPASAYEVAERVERLLHDEGRHEVSVDELRDVVVEVLRDGVGHDAALRYVRWQHAQDRELPLIVLIGGATGAGKSTVATQVANRLGVTRIVSTDAVREVMRSTVSSELLPALHVSSFEAREAVPEALRPGVDPLLIGFLRQVATVTVGVSHVVERAIIEQTDMIVEGVHLVPGVMRLPASSEAITVPIMLHVADVDVHRSHLSGRSQDVSSRPQHRYLQHFDSIRRIHDYLAERTAAEDVDSVRTYSLDQTVAEVTALIVEAVGAARAYPPVPWDGEPASELRG
jgi:2-phosphoglycerate kinase